MLFFENLNSGEFYTLTESYALDIYHNKEFKVYSLFRKVSDSCYVQITDENYLDTMRSDYENIPKELFKEYREYDINMVLVKKVTIGVIR